MKIMLYIESLQIGGAETLLVRNALAFRERGEDVVVAVNRLTGSFLEERLVDNGVRIVPLIGPKSYVRGYRSLRKLARSLITPKRAWERLLAKESPSVVHLHSLPNVFLEELPFPAARFAFSFHSAVSRVKDMANDLQWRSVEYLAQQGGMIVVISSVTEGEILDQLSPAAVSVIPNCLDVEQLSKGGLSKEAFLRGHGLPDDSFILGHVGRFHPVKNHEKLFSILLEMIRRHPHSYLVLVGDGSSQRKAELVKEIDRQGLTEHVIFCGFQEHPASIISACDAMALPSFVEGFSLVALEAQSLGKRCVVSSALPLETKCRPDYFFLGIEEPSSLWADYILGDFLEPENCSDILDFDESRVVPKLLKMYQGMLSAHGYAGNEA